jgi:hypothetical protein
MRMEFGPSVLWVALALSAFAPRVTAAQEPARDAAKDAEVLQTRLELLARMWPDGPDLSQGLNFVHRDVESAARDAGFSVESLAARAQDPVVSGDAGYVPVEVITVLRSKASVDDTPVHGYAPWTFVERYLRRTQRLAIFDRLRFQVEAEGALRFSGLVHLQFRPLGTPGLTGRELYLAKISAIAALREQQWWPLRRLDPLAAAPGGGPKGEPYFLLTDLSVTRTEVSAEGIAPWPVSGRDWWPARELNVSSVEWTQEGSCQRFSVKARFPKPDPGGQEPPLESPAQDLALLLARPGDVCRAEDPSPRRFPFVKVSGKGPLTLRARDVDLLDVALLLHRLAGKFVVVDEDVAGRVSLDLVGVTLEQALAALAPFGVTASPPALVRHVSFGRPALPLTLRASQDKLPVSFSFQRWPLPDVLRLFEDITGDKVLMPPGPPQQVSVFVEELPVEVIYDAVLGPLGLRFRREPGLIHVERLSRPSEYAGLPPSTGRPRRFSFSEVAGDQVQLSALSSTGGGVWTAWMLTPRGFLEEFKEGTILWDGKVLSVDEKGATIQITSMDPLATERSRTRRLDLAPAR